MKEYIELDLCPCCGSPVNLRVLHDNKGGLADWFIYCKVCGLTMNMDDDTNPEETAERWNQRIETLNIRKAIELLNDIYLRGCIRYDDYSQLFDAIDNIPRISINTEEEEE